MDRRRDREALMRRFKARAVSAGEDASLNTFLIVLAEHVDGDGARLEIHQALSFDEQDKALGQDTYCLMDESGATHYGGVSCWSLREGVLEMELTELAAKTLEADPKIVIDLVADEPSIERLDHGLRRLLGPPVSN